MSNLNLCQFMGHLGADPDVRHSDSGNAIGNFSIACGEKWKDKTSGEIQEHTEWVRCVCFGKRAETISQYFKKGHPIYVQGRMRTRKWQGDDGKDRWTTEVLVDRFDFLQGRSDGAADQQKIQQQAAAYQKTANAGGTDEDIPF